MEETLDYVWRYWVYIETVGLIEGVELWRVDHDTLVEGGKLSTTEHVRRVRKHFFGNGESEMARREKRDTYRYQLKEGHKVVYIGVTNDPPRRQEEHHQDSKRFSHMTVVGPRVREESALEWEQKSLKSFQRNHGGKTPKYNA